jgi:hypothetical protein
MSRKRQWGEDSTTWIELSAGASVAVIFKGNLFDLTAAEGALLSDLRGIIQKYRDVANGQPARAEAAS